MKQCADKDKRAVAQRQRLSVCACNKLFAHSAVNPLATVIPLKGSWPVAGLPFDGYAVALLRGVSQNGQYGCCEADFTDTTVLFATPGEARHWPLDAQSSVTGVLLLWSAELMVGNALNDRLPEFGFLRYSAQEALHLSTAESTALQIALNTVEQEIAWGTDILSAALLCDKISVVLHLCRRYYNRQMLLRSEVCEVGFAERTVHELKHFFLAGGAVAGTLPEAAQWAERAGMSEAYFSDFVCMTIGTDFSTLVQQQRMEAAKQLLLTLNDDAVALRLGFVFPEVFRQQFSGITGLSTQTWRQRMAGSK